MALKFKHASKDQVPDEQAALYVERGGAVGLGGFGQEHLGYAA
jgi:hypothetical protein